MKQYKIILFLTLMATVSSMAQEFGAFPPSIDWQQINTKSVRVIFPQGMDAQAKRVVNTLAYMDQYNRTTIGTRKRKLNLLLNNQGVIPNGFVTLMPYRSEFYTTPMQSAHELGSLPWLDLLSIHEYRHAHQFTNLNQGVTKLAYILGGDQMLAIASNLTVPNWFFEGDAVVMETALTQQGRGRVPAFLKGYKSILGSEKNFTYMKARNGSYKDDVPDHYRLGYLLCSYGREQYNDHLWMDVLNSTARFQGIVYPFSKALRAQTGSGTAGFYREAMEHYQEEWKANDLVQSPRMGTSQSKNVRTPTYYRYPVFDPRDNNWLVNKRSYKKASAIYSVDASGSEKKLVETGIQIDPYFSASKKYIVWTEISWHPRFSAIDYSDIVLYDRESQSIRYLSNGARLVSPSISPDEQELVAVNVDQQSRTQIVIMSSQSGKINLTIPNPEDLFFAYPVVDASGSILTTGRNKDGKMFIGSVNRESGQVTYLLPPINHIIGPVFAGQQYVYFSASFNGNDDIYCLQRQSGRIYQITESQYGAFEPAVNPQENTLLFGNQHFNGQSLNSISLDPSRWSSISIQNLDLQSDVPANFVSAEGGIILDKISEREHPVRPYRPIMHALKFHSWTPSLPLSSTAVGLSIVSDNVINNFHFNGGLNYYLNEQAPGYSMEVVFGKWFPILSLGYSQLYRHPGILNWNDPGNWERTISGGVQVPINFSKGRFMRQAQAATSLQRTSIPTRVGADLYSGSNTHFTAIKFHSITTITKIRAQQNITTPLGAGMELLVNKSLGALSAGQIQFNFDGAIRGIFPNHNVVVGLSGKLESTKNQYQYPDLNIYPRGYAIQENNSIVTFSGNYHFPLFYPDIGFPGLIYFMRIRANTFLDVGFGNIINPQTRTPVDASFISLGGELIVDTQIFNLFPLPLGIRYSLLGTTDLEHPGRSGRLEFFIPVLRL